MNPTQCRMARAAIGLGVRELAAEAKVSPDTVARFERGEAIKDITAEALTAVFEMAGVTFATDGSSGVAVKPLRKFEEMLDYGRVSRRVAYVLDPVNLPPLRKGGTTWREVQDFDERREMQQISGARRVFGVARLKGRATASPK